MNYITILVFCILTVAISTCGGKAAYCPYKFQLWDTDKCIWMSELSGHVSNAVRHCTHRGAFPPVLENAKQNDDLQTRLQYGSKKLLPLACTNNGTDGQWICNYKESSEWYWKSNETTDNKGYWNWAEGQPDLASDIEARIFLSPSGDWVDEREGGTHDMAVACNKTTVTEDVNCELPYENVDNKCLFTIPNFNGTSREARQACTALNGSLVTIDSKNQNDILLKKVQDAGRTRMLIGCTYRNDTGAWRCDDRIYPYMVHWTNISSAGFWNWEDGHPWANRSCAYLLAEDGTWRSGSCQRTNRMLVACERAPTTVQCPPEYQPWNETQCIHVGAFTGSASDAQAKCNAKGGTVLVVDSEELNSAVSYRVQSLDADNMILGCNDKEEDGNWVCEGQNKNEWFWKSKTENSGYWNWRPNEPDGEKENCAFINGKAKGKYVSESCDAEFKTTLACVYSAVTAPESSLSTAVIVSIVIGVVVALAVVLFIGTACYAKSHPSWHVSGMNDHSGRPSAYPTSINFSGKTNVGYSETDKADLIDVDIE